MYVCVFFLKFVFGHAGCAHKLLLGLHSGNWQCLGDHWELNLDQASALPLYYCSRSLM